MLGALNTIAPKSIPGVLTQLWNSCKMSLHKKCMCSSIYVALPDKPAYFTKQTLSSPNKDSLSAANVNLSKYVGSDFDLLMFQPTIDAQECLERYIKTAIITQKIIRNLPELEGGWSFCCSTSDHGHWLDTTHSESLKRGVFLFVNKSSDKEDIFRTVEKYGVKEYYHFHHIKDNCYKRITLNINASDDGGETLTDEDNFICDIFPSVNKHGSPKKSDVSGTITSTIFASSEFCPVFHEYSRCRSILQKCSDLPEVVELLGIADKLIPHDFSVEEMESNMKFPFVVVEGMDATGKTTLTKNLEEKLNAARFYTPPPPLQHLRKFFDTLPEIVRRAYYSIGNYIVAMEISKECSERAVLMDRYWHSTAAYGIANETSSGDLPPVGHAVYKWPTDLLKPSIVLFLTVTEDIRKQRLQGRGLEKTFEEQSLDKDKMFRQRLCDSYRRMQEPECVEIDASGTVEDVQSAASSALLKHEIDITAT